MTIKRLAVCATLILAMTYPLAAKPPAKQKSRIKPKSVAASPTDFEIYFEGLVAHVFGGTPRAVMVRDKSNVHTAHIFLPPNLVETELTDAGVDFKCTAVCEVKLTKGVGVRLVADDSTTTDVDPAIINAPVSSSPFSKQVPHLKGLVSTFDLKPEVGDQVPSQTDVLAYFELRGSVFKVVETHACKGRFKGVETKFHDFAKVVQLSGTTRSTPMFQFRTGTNDWKSVHFKSPPPRVRVLVVNTTPEGDNSPKHMHMFEQLAKTTVTLPDVEVQACLTTTSLVPGCSNTQWP